MKQFFPKNHVYAHIAACVLTLTLFVLSACQNFVIPTMARQTSKSTAMLTELKTEWWDEDGSNYSSYRPTLQNGGKTEMFTVSGFDENVNRVVITFKVNDPKAEVVYDRVDRVLFARSDRMAAYLNPATGVGTIEFDMRYKFDTDVYIYVGRYTYTVRIQKSVTNNRIYVSADANRDDTIGGELRGYTPETAFYSLKNAIARGMLTERCNIYIIGELKDDPQETSADATFVIENIDKRLRIWSHNNGGKLVGKSGKRVLNVIDADVTFIGLGIEGGNISADGGGGVHIESSRAAFLDCTIKDNFSMQTGGAVYLADQRAGRAPATATFSGNTKMQGNAARDSSSAGVWAGENSKLVFENAEIDDAVYVKGAMSVPSSSTAKLGNVLVSGSGSAAIEGTVTGSGDTEVTGSGTLTVKGDGCFTSSGKIKLAAGRKITIDGNLTNQSPTGIEPQEWKIGNPVLDGTLTTANSEKFSMRAAPPRHMWKVDAAGKLAHSVDDSITFSEAGTDKKPTVSGSFYLGADYITVTNASIVNDNYGAGATVFIYAEPENGLENIKQTEINTGGKAVFTFSTTEPAAVDAAKNGRYRDDTKRAIGVLYKLEADKYILKLDMVTDSRTPTYQVITDSRFPITVSDTAGASGPYTYTYTDTYGNSYADAYYHIKLAGAAGGNGGRANGVSNVGGESGAVGTAGVRGSNGIAYGIGARGNNGGDGFGGGGGGGGGGGDSWVKGDFGYYIATGGNGGLGTTYVPPIILKYGGGGGGGGGNKAGVDGLGASVAGGGGGAGAGVGGGIGGRNGWVGGVLTAASGGQGGILPGGNALVDSYIFAGGGGGGGAGENYSRDVGGTGGTGGGTPKPGGGSLLGGGGGIGGGGGDIGGNNPMYGSGGLSYTTGYFHASPFVERFTDTTNGSTGAGKLEVLGVITYTRP